jgi:hypothetical protein
MDGPRDRIPDAITPIVGYRVWVYEMWENRAELHSLASVIGKPRPETELWEEATGRWISSSCRAPWTDREHRAPVEDCSCGFYAMSSLQPLLAEAGEDFRMPVFRVTREWRPPPEDGLVLGRIEMAGKVIEHERGYRAERARIVELIPIEGIEQPITRLGARLGVTVGHPVRLPPPPTRPRPTVRAPRPRTAVMRSPPRGRTVREWLRSRPSGGS